jgi:hypothetical protein
MAKYYEHDIARWEGEGGGTGADMHTSDTGTSAALEKGIDGSRWPGTDLLRNSQEQSGNQRCRYGHSSPRTTVNTDFTTCTQY